MKSKLTSFVQRTLAASVLGMLLTATTSAQANNPPPTIKADAPNRYVVKKGDTLWGIAGRYLDKPWRWKEIWAANRQIKNPNLIYPNDVLALCIIQGKTLVGIDTGEGCAGIEKQLKEKAKAAPAQVAITSTANSIPPIPLAAISSWLEKYTIVNPNDFNTTPYIIASQNRNLITGEGNKVYAKGLPLIVGQRYGVYHKGQPYIDPVTKQTIGLEVLQVATGIVTSVAGNGVSTIELLQSYGQEVQEGDRVFVELGNSVPPIFYPEPAQVNRGGQIIRVLDSIGKAAQGSVVAINLGTVNGAKPGDVLTVYHKGALVRDTMDHDMPVRLPSEEAGMLMIFKTFDNISYAYVLSSEIPLGIGDQLLPPSYL